MCAGPIFSAAAFTAEIAGGGGVFGVRRRSVFGGGAARRSVYLCLCVLVPNVFKS